jgi:hypothetical protein
MDATSTVPGTCIRACRSGRRRESCHSIEAPVWDRVATARSCLSLLMQRSTSARAGVTTRSPSPLLMAGIGVRLVGQDSGGAGDSGDGPAPHSRSSLRRRGIQASIPSHGVALLVDRGVEGGWPGRLVGRAGAMGLLVGSAVRNPLPVSTPALRPRHIPGAARRAPAPTCRPTTTVGVACRRSSTCRTQPAGRARASRSGSARAFR